MTFNFEISRADCISFAPIGHDCCFVVVVDFFFVVVLFFFVFFFKSSDRL